MRLTPFFLAGCAALALAGSATAASAPAPAIDPAALAALDKMGAALRSHMTFVLTADVSDEDVLDTGQKLQYDGKLEVRARRPDRFLISSTSDERTRNFYYDGKAVTVFSPKLGMYASFAAPPTIAETLTKANQDYGIVLRLDGRSIAFSSSTVAGSSPSHFGQSASSITAGIRLAIVPTSLFGGTVTIAKVSIAPSFRRAHRSQITAMAVAGRPG